MAPGEKDIKMSHTNSKYTKLSFTEQGLYFKRDIITKSNLHKIEQDQSK